jgi:hypothetical protein
MILVSTSLPNLSPQRITQIQAQRTGAWARNNGWANAPSGGAPLPGVTLQKIPVYKTTGYGSG